RRPLRRNRRLERRRAGGAPAHRHAGAGRAAAAGRRRIGAADRRVLLPAVAARPAVAPRLPGLAGPPPLLNAECKAGMLAVNRVPEPRSDALSAPRGIPANSRPGGDAEDEWKLRAA